MILLCWLSLRLSIALLFLRSLKCSIHIIIAQYVIKTFLLHNWPIRLINSPFLYVFYCIRNHINLWIIGYVSFCPFSKIFQKSRIVFFIYLQLLINSLVTSCLSTCDLMAWLQRQRWGSCLQRSSIVII